MLGKVVMCECFYQILQSEGSSYEKNTYIFTVDAKKNMCCLFYFVTGILTVLIQIKK